MQQDPYGHSSLFSISKPNFLKTSNLKDCLRTDDDTSTFTGTKVVATLGPSCHGGTVLPDMLRAGLVGAVVDLTWGSLDFHKQSLDALQKAMAQTRKLCCTMVETQGREVMVRRQVKVDDKGWHKHEEGFSVSAGQKITITNRNDVVASASVLPVTYDGFNEMCQPGDTIYVGRYLVCGAESASLYLEVEEIRGADLICVAKNDAVLEGLLTLFHVERSFGEVLNMQNQQPLLSDYDRQVLVTLAKDYEIDFLILSYTRDAEDVEEAREFLDMIGMENTKIIAKLASRQSLLNFKGILNQADGIIICRGSLGLDCQPEKMAMIQKTLIKACNLVGKPVLLTHVVDTMLNTPRPTRAEATDVANAVLDGVDGVVLGAESLRGRYPVQTVSTVTKICRSAEKVFDHQYHYDHLMEVAVDVQSKARSNHRAAARQDTTEDETGDESDGNVSTRSGAPAAAPPAASAAAAAAEAKRHVGFTAEAKAKIQRSMTSPRETMPRISSVGIGNMKLESAAQAMAQYGMTSSHADMAHLMPHTRKGTTRLNKLESISSSAVRTADRVQASLIVVYTRNGETPKLVAKYRPPMPILTLVVPQLVSDSIHWKLEGRTFARQCLLSRGLLPLLSAPGHNEDTMLHDAVRTAHRLGMVKAHDHVVCVQRIHDDYCVKVLSVDSHGTGLKRLARNDSGHHLSRARRPSIPSVFSQVEENLRMLPLPTNLAALPSSIGRNLDARQLSEVEDLMQGAFLSTPSMMY